MSFNVQGNLTVLTVNNQQIDVFLCVFSLFVVCVLKVDQRSGNLYWVSCGRNVIGSNTADNGYPQELYRSKNAIQDFCLDWLRGGLIWLEEGRILTMSVMGGKVTELLQLAGGVRGNIAFDLRANSLFWNTKRAGELLKDQYQNVVFWP